MDGMGSAFVAAARPLPPFLAAPSTLPCSARGGCWGAGAAARGPAPGRWQTCAHMSAGASGWPQGQPSATPSPHALLTVGQTPACPNLPAGRPHAPAFAAEADCLTSALVSTRARAERQVVGERERGAHTVRRPRCDQHHHPPLTTLPPLRWCSTLRLPWPSEPANMRAPPAGDASASSTASAAAACGVEAWSPRFAGPGAGDRSAPEAVEPELHTRRHDRRAITAPARTCAQPRTPITPPDSVVAQQQPGRPGGARPATHHQATRLARGVPAGSEIEYVDAGTVAWALMERRPT